MLSSMIDLVKAVFIGAFAILILGISIIPAFYAFHLQAVVNYGLLAQSAVALATWVMCAVLSASVLGIIK